MFLSLQTRGRAQAPDPSKSAPEQTAAHLDTADRSAAESPESPVPDANASDSIGLPDAPQAPQNSTPAQTTAPAPPGTSINNGEQTKRILLIIPNFRAASVDAKLPPMSAGEEFKLVLQDSFDYSSFIYVGIVAGVGQAQKSYPAFGQGAVGYGRYYWHSLADSIGENAFTEFLVPYPTHEDPRYYTLGRGGFPKRLVYSVSRLAITRNNDAKETVNLAEIVGAGASAGLSNLYYPSAYSTWTKTGQKWITQIGIDGLGNVVKEFWPDVNAHVFRNKF
jgi:hypothetical protein